MLHLKGISGAYVSGKERELWTNFLCFKFEETWKVLFLPVYYCLCSIVRIIIRMNRPNFTFWVLGLSLSIFLRLPSKPSSISTSSWAINLGCFTEATWIESLMLITVLMTCSFLSLAVCQGEALPLFFLKIILAIPALLLSSI